jgi:ferredoxin
MGLRIRVNPITCAGHGVCAEMLPERIKLDEWGYPVIDQDPIPAELDRRTRQAVAKCPTLALLVVEGSERN